MSARALTVLFAGGGSAGHLLPAIATAEALAATFPNTEFTRFDSWYLATARGAELPILQGMQAQYILVPKTDFPRKVNSDLLTFFPRLIGAVLRAMKVIRINKVDVVVGFGGFVSLPAYLAASLSHIPLVVHEANALPGLANRLGKRLTSSAFANFPIPGWNENCVISLPIRPSISAISELKPAIRGERQRAARKEFGLVEEKKTILIFGGSLGAQAINKIVVDSIDTLVDRGFQILHVVGPGNSLPTSRPGYHPLAYISQMERAYLASDVVVARSGAGSCAEIAATGLPAVLIPLNVGNGEQLLNARALAKTSAVWIIENNELTSKQLVEAVVELAKKPIVGKVETQSAANRLAVVIFDLARSRSKNRAW